MENIVENKKQLIVVIGLAKNNEGKILLQKRIDPLIIGANEKWELPGGRIDYGETPEETVCREFIEETGCEIKIKRLLPFAQSSVWKRTDGGEQQVIVICYEAEIISGEPRPQDRKVLEIKWFSKEEILNLDTLRGINKFIELAV